MIWLYERGAQAVRLETRFDNETEEYVVVIAWTDRAPTTERCRNVEQFQARIRALEQQLDADHWTLVGPPHITPDGWRGP